jgi:DNA repair exonuclease SbcCD ATPase subunit
MATEKQNDSFRISFDEEPAEENEQQIQAELEDLKVEKLSHRVTLITILIPILIVVILGVTYLDIKRRVISTETSGSKGFENLSRDLESRFSTLSLRQAKLEEEFAAQSGRVDEAAAAMGVRIKETDAALKALGASTVSQKGLKKSVADALGSLDEKLAPLTQQLAATNERLTTQGQDTAARLSELEGLFSTMDPVLADLRASLQSLREEIESLEKEKITKKQMDLALKLDRLHIISDLQAQDKRLEQQLGELSRQLTLVRGELTDLENRLYPQRRRTISPQPGAKPTPKPSPDKPDAKEGITEQDLD